MPMKSAAPAILYVDDEEIARKQFERSFGASRPVLTAAATDEALGMLRNGGNNIGILVTDFRLTGKHNGDLMRQAVAAFPQVVCILLTDHSDREALMNTANNGEVFCTVEKPVDHQRLEQALCQAEELLHLRGARRLRLQAAEETIAFLAHELNTPLAAIVNYSNGIHQRLQGSGLTPAHQAEMLKAVEALGDNARYCMEMISFLVASSRSAGILHPVAGETSARQLLLAMLDAYPLSPAQRSWISLEVQEDFNVAGLPSCVSLVLSTLLGYALHSLKDQAAPSIVIKVSGGKPSCISMTDNGAGIRNEVVYRLLQDPVRLHADSGGKDMGLIFCRRVMQAFNGDITVEFRQGVSTTVKLTFPTTN